MDSLEEVKRISGFDRFLMMSTAVLIDTIQAILALVGIGLVVDSAIDVFAWLIFYAWFMMRGVSYNDSRKIALAGATALIEAIPALNAISPTFTIQTYLIIKMVETEDRLKNEQRRKAYAEQIAKNKAELARRQMASQ